MIDMPLQSLIQRLADNGAWAALLSKSGFYETGTFTPTFAGTGTAGTFTHAFQRGYYDRQGNRVSFMVNVGISAITVAPTGTMTIAGLPFIAGEPTIGLTTTFSLGYTNNVDYPAGALELKGRILVGTSAIQLLYTRDAATITLYPAASFTGNEQIFVEGFYYV